MSRNQNFHRRLAPAAIVLVALAVSSCGVTDQVAPTIGAPSEASLSLNVAVSADRIQRDGASQSTVTIQARDEAGGPAAGRRILISATGPDGTTLSAREVTTLADGRATFSVTAPPSGSLGDIITVGMTPVDGSGNPTHVTRTVSIRLTPSNTGAPTASFTFSPATPGVNEQVNFSGTGSTDEGVACGTRCGYAWNFGDGNGAIGMIVSNSYSTSGNKSVTLTVTDAAGVASLPFTQVVPVAAPSPPEVGTVAVSPTPVAPGDIVNFDASGAKVGAGATIVDFTWVWGDGNSEVTTTPFARHQFVNAGTYTVRTTVRDSLGRTGTATTPVEVKVPTPVPAPTSTSAP